MWISPFREKCPENVGTIEVLLVLLASLLLQQLLYCLWNVGQTLLSYDIISNVFSKQNSRDMATKTRLLGQLTNINLSLADFWDKDMYGLKLLVYIMKWWWSIVKPNHDRPTVLFHNNTQLNLFLCRVNLSVIWYSFRVRNRSSAIGIVVWFCFCFCPVRIGINTWPFHRCTMCSRYGNHQWKLSIYFAGKTKSWRAWLTFMWTLCRLKAALLCYVIPLKLFVWP